MREWKDAIRNHHGKWWYVVRKDKFPWYYWNKYGTNWTGFYGEAFKYRTKNAAEKVALILVGKFPTLLGVVGVHER